MRATEGRRFAEEGGEQYQKTTKTQARSFLGNRLRVHVLQARVAYQNLKFYRECQPIK